MDNAKQTYATSILQHKKTAQSNHDPFVIPPSLQQYADEPLYILIALWCRQQNDWSVAWPFQRLSVSMIAERRFRYLIFPGIKNGLHARYGLSEPTIHSAFIMKSE
ncbi:CaiF/GrlA family transcriptional regulator [Salmonella enterica]|nr:CaiF/GrlA family transcriptional regulator [Salmonella enterica]ELQ3451767.1 CaiF/GrlA family transcriptional regulator [Salmonella enterica]